MYNYAISFINLYVQSCWSLGSGKIWGAKTLKSLYLQDLEDKLHPGGPSDPLGLADDLDQAALLEVKEVKKTCNVCDARILVAWLSVGIKQQQGLGMYIVDVDFGMEGNLCIQTVPFNLII